MKASTAAAVLAMATQHVSAQDSDPNAGANVKAYPSTHTPFLSIKPSQLTLPVMYRITAHQDERCAGPAVRFQRFHCALTCTPLPSAHGARSIRLSAWPYEELPWHADADDQTFGGSNPSVDPMYISTEGPMAMAYGDGECTRHEFRARAHIKTGDTSACITLEGAVRGLQTVLLKSCGLREQEALVEAARARNRELREEEWLGMEEEGMREVVRWQYYEGIGRGELEMPMPEDGGEKGKGEGE